MAAAKNYHPSNEAQPRQFLSKELRRATERSHAEVESSNFIKNVMNGSCSESAYRNYLWSLREIYQSLERNLAKNKSHPFIAPIYFPELFRLEALNSDLAEWTRFDGFEIGAYLMRNVQMYAERLNDLGRSHPTYLVAHAYVRYLGDLSGGQLMMRALKKSFPQKSGFEFYNFSGVDIERMKDTYRDRLDMVGQRSESVIGEICHEAQKAFQLSGAMFKALG